MSEQLDLLQVAAGLAAEFRAGAPKVVSTEALDPDLFGRRGDLYRKRGWDPKIEKKWTHMDAAERDAFSHVAVNMATHHPGITLHGIVVNKTRVMDHIRADPNKLYNYAIHSCLLRHLSSFDAVTLVPDPRSVKVASGNALPDYLQMELWFKMGVKTTLQAKPRDSADSLQVQFVDMLAGLIQSRYEDGDSADFQKMWPRLRMRYLFFKR